MAYRGVVRGKTIELEEPLPYPEGQSVNVSVEPLSTPSPGSPAAIRQVMHESPHLTAADLDELERMIEEGKLPVLQAIPAKG